VKFAQVPGLTVTMQNPPRSAWAAWRARRFTSTACRNRCGRSCSLAPLLMEKMSKSRFPGCVDGHANRRPAGQRADRPRQGRRAGVTPQQMENGLYDAYGERAGVHDYADVAEYWGSSRLTAISTRSHRARAALHRQFSGRHQWHAQACSLDAVAKLTRPSAPPTSISPMSAQLPAGDNLLQPGHRAIRWDRRLINCRKIEKTGHASPRNQSPAVFRAAAAGL